MGFAKGTRPSTHAHKAGVGEGPAPVRARNEGDGHISCLQGLATPVNLFLGDRGITGVS
jgi:hypothetical protein